MRTTRSTTSSAGGREGDRGAPPLPARAPRWTSVAGSPSWPVRVRCRSRSGRSTSLTPVAASFAGSTTTSAARTISSSASPGMVRVVVLDRDERRDVPRGHRRREPGRDLRSRHQRSRLRGTHGCALRLPRDRGVRRGRSRRARCPVGRPAGQALWSTQAPISPPGMRNEAPRHRRRPASSARTSCGGGSSAIRTTTSSRSTGSRTPATREPRRARVPACAVGRHLRPRAGRERLLAEERIDTIVNFAAESHNSLAVLDPGRFFRTNVLGTQTLLEAARRAASSASTTSRRARCTATCRSTPTRRSPRSRRTGRGRRTTPRRPAPTTPCARTSRRSSCPSRSRTARTTTGRRSSRRR